MNVGRPDSKLFAIWQSHVPGLVSSLQLKHTLDSQSQNNLIIIPPIQGEYSQYATANYINYIIGDTISKYFSKQGIHHTTVWGFNTFSLSLEINAIVQTALSYKGVNTEHIKDVVDEDVSYEVNKLFLQQEKKWWDILKKSGVLFPNQMLYYTNDNTVIEIVWYLVSKIWNRHKMSLTPHIDLYWEKEHTYLLQQELSHNQTTYSHTEIEQYTHQNNNLFVDKVKAKNIITTFKLKGLSAGRLSASILTETNTSIGRQSEIYDSIISQLLHLKDLGYISKVEKRLDLFINSKEDTLFSIASIKRPRWSNWEVDEEVAVKVETLKTELDTIEENITILEKIHTILEDEADIRLLSWFSRPYLAPAVSALAVQPDAEYALYFLEEKGQIVIIAESQAIAVLSRILPKEQQPGPELQMLLENEIDGGEYFSSQNIPIHKLVSLKGEDLIGIEFDPLFIIDEISSQNMSPFTWTVVPYQALDYTIGTGIYPVTPPYGKKDFEIAQSFDLPLIRTVDDSSQYILHGTEKSPVDSIKKSYSIHDHDLTSHIVDLLDEVDALFAVTHTWNNEFVIRQYDPTLLQIYKDKLEKNKNLPQLVTQEPDEIDSIKSEIVSYEEQLFYKQYDNYITKVSHPHKKTLLDIPLTELKKHGIPLPLWKSTDGSTIFVENIEKLLQLSLNPTYTLINSRKLAPEMYKDKSVVVLGDRNTKLPLGLTVIFYKSNTLSEMRKERNISLKEFSEYGSKLLDEVYTIFKKHKTVQVLLEPHEQELLTMWLGGYSPRSEVIEEKFYFYNSLTQVFIEDEKEEFDLPDNTIITQDFGTGKTNIVKHYYIPSPECKQLSLKRPYIDEILLEDGTGKIYHREPFVLSNTYLNAMLMDGSVWQELVYNTQPLKSFMSYSMHDENDEKEGVKSQKLGFSNSKNSLLISHPSFASYKAYQLDVTQSKHIQTFPNLQEPSQRTPHFGMSIDALEHAVETYGADSIRYIACKHCNDTKGNFSPEHIASTAGELDDLFSTTTKYLQTLLNKFPRNNPPLSKNKYKHVINRWLQTYTINYCLQIEFYMQDGDFEEISALYTSYLKTITKWYYRIVKLLDHSILPEVTECLCESLYWFSVSSFHFQPISCESLYQQLPITQWSEYSCFSHPKLEFKEPSITDIEVLDIIHSVKEMVGSIESLRRRHKIKLRQPLYCDTTRLHINSEVVDIIVSCANLKQKTSTTPATEHSEIIENSLGRIKIDTTIYEELATLGFGWEIERAIIEFLKRNKFNRDETITFKIAIGECENETLVHKAMNTVDWHKLNIEVRWDKETATDAYSVQVSDLATFYLEHIEQE